MKITCVQAPSGEILMVLDDGSPMPTVCGQFTPAPKSAALANELMLMYNNQHAEALLPTNVVDFKRKEIPGGAKDA